MLLLLANKNNLFLEKLKDENKMLHENVQEGLNKIQSFEKQILELQEGREKWEAKFETLNESYNEVKSSLFFKFICK